MTTDTLQLTGTGTIKWSPIAGYLPPIFQDESQDISNPELVDAVMMVEWNPIAAEQLGRISLKNNNGKSYVRLKAPELLESRNYEGR